MPCRTATLSSMFTSSASPTAPPEMLGTAERPIARSRKRLLQAAAAALLCAGGMAFAQTPACFDSVGRALPSKKCSQAARDQATEQAVASGAG